MVFKNIISLILTSLLTTSCTLWPYETDFDCPIKEGLKCKSLYEISMMQEEGAFGPNGSRNINNEKNKLNLRSDAKEQKISKKCRCCKSRKGKY